MSLEDKTKKRTSGGLAELVGLTIGLGIQILTLPARLEYQKWKSEEEEKIILAVKELMRIKEEEKNNSIVSCYSCKEDYRFGDRGNAYCSDLCEKRGRIVFCDNGCGRDFFKNEGYRNRDGNFCSGYCWDDYTY